MNQLSIYYIYHIVGRKVGCTLNLKSRMKQYERDEGKKPEYEILEKLYNKTDKEAGDIEWDWADKFGYRRGIHYTTKTGFKTGEAGRRSAEILTSEERSERGRKANEKLSLQQLSERGRKAGKARMHSMTPEQRSEFGQESNAKMTPQQLAEAGRRGGSRTAELGLGFKTATSEDQARWGTRGGNSPNGGCHRDVACPTCGKVGKLAAMHRWHFDNCPHK